MIPLARQIVGLCRCGCGESAYYVNPYGRRHSGFRPGHNNASRRRQVAPDAEVGCSRRHQRSRELVGDRSRCAWEFLGSCRGPVETAHVNGDDSDNRRSNLKALCRSHHSLLDNGRIDPANPVMPAFYVDGSGKRRYVAA